MQVDPISKCLGVKTNLPADKLISLLNQMVANREKQQAKKNKEYAESIPTVIKRIEKIAKEGPEPPQEPFPDIDYTKDPITINAVEISALTQTEAAYYFATTDTNLALPGVHSKGGDSASKGLEEGKKPRNANKTGTIKKKRREPEHGEKPSEGDSNDAESVHEVQREEKGRNEEEEPCTVCSREYEDGDKMIQCDGSCKKWYHIECAKVSPEEFDRLSKDKKGVWKCRFCSGGITPPIHAKIASNKSIAETGRKKRKLNHK